jgi:hypothetical protein
MDNPVRHITKDEIISIAEWAIPRYKERHPRLTIDRMLPILLEAVADRDNFQLIRTDNACGLFVVEQSPWEPLKTVCDIFAVGRAGCGSAAFEACRLYKYAMDWAKDIGGIEFRYGTDGLSDLSGIAQRIGYDIVATNYVKRL